MPLPTFLLELLVFALFTVIGATLWRVFNGNSVESQIKELVAKALDKNARLERLNNTLDENQTALAKRDDTLADFRKELLSRSDAIVEAERKLSGIEASSSVKAGEASDLKALLAEKSDLHGEVSRKLAALQPTLHRREEEHDAARRRLPDLDNKANALEQQASAAEREAARLAEEQRTAAAELEATREKAEEMAKVCAQLETMVDILGQLSGSQDELDALQTELGTVVGEDLPDPLSSDEGAAAALTERLARARSDMQQLEDEVRSLEQRRGEARGKLQGKASEEDARNADVQRAVADSESGEFEGSRVRDVLLREEETSRSLEHDRRKNLAARDEAAPRLQALTAERDELVARKQAAEKALAALGTLVPEITTSLSRTREELARQESALDTLRAEPAKKEAALAPEKDAAERAEERSRAAERRKAELPAELSKLDATLRTLQDEVAVLEQESAGSQADVAGYEDRRAERERDLQQLERKLGQLEGSIAEEKSETNRLRLETDDMKVKSKQIRAKLGFVVDSIKADEG